MGGSDDIMFQRHQEQRCFTRGILVAGLTLLALLTALTGGVLFVLGNVSQNTEELVSQEHLRLAELQRFRLSESLGSFDKKEDGAFEQPDTNSGNNRWKRQVNPPPTSTTMDAEGGVLVTNPNNGQQGYIFSGDDTPDDFTTADFLCKVTGQGQYGGFVRMNKGTKSLVVMRFLQCPNGAQSYDDCDFQWLGGRGRPKDKIGRQRQYVVGVKCSDDLNSVGPDTTVDLDGAVQLASPYGDVGYVAGDYTSSSSSWEDGTSLADLICRWSGRGEYGTFVRVTRPTKVSCVSSGFQCSYNRCTPQWWSKPRTRRHIFGVVCTGSTTSSTSTTTTTTSPTTTTTTTTATTTTPTTTTPTTTTPTTTTPTTTTSASTTETTSLVPAPDPLPEIDPEGAVTVLNPVTQERGFIVHPRDANGIDADTATFLCRAARAGTTGFGMARRIAPFRRVVMRSITCPANAQKAGDCQMDWLPRSGRSNFIVRVDCS